MIDTVDGELAAQLRSLPRTEYLLLMLTAVEGYSTSEAAAAVGITASAARTRLSRTKARLRPALTSSRTPIGEEVG